MGLQIAATRKRVSTMLRYGSCLRLVARCPLCIRFSARRMGIDHAIADRLPDRGAGQGRNLRHSPVAQVTGRDLFTFTTY